MSQTNEPMSVSDPYAFYTKTIVSLLMGNIGTTQVHADELSILTNQNELLSKAWTSHIPADSGSAKAMMDAWNGINSSSSMNQFINTYCTAPYLDSFSGAFCTEVMTKLTTYWDSSKTSKSPVEMNIVNGWTQIVSSTGQNEEMTGQSLTKMESSVVQQDAGAQQGFSDMANTVFGVVGNYASLLSQQY